ncbi:HEAT repeat domain-containing protein, partial [bacterium]|nr:HEAT repeat domain-containing protein [bacterium]
AIAPLMEVLADEPDMAARKALVDMIAAMAQAHIGELGKRTSDPRWYFVRNLVGILGSTRSPSALPHLSRTLRHADARVRRETIRAAASIRDRLADEMLVAALADDDPQNVALAARYLGSLRVPFSAAALAQVARGEGRGSRDLAPKVEAIEALGALGTEEAAAALAELGRHRSVLRGGRSREMQAAIEAALARAARGRRE